MYKKKSPKSRAKVSSKININKTSENLDSSELIIPKSVKVGGITYDVNVVEQQFMNDEVGLTDYRGAKIFVSKNESREFMEETFMHELVHAMLAHSGYVEHDEVMVESLAQSLYGVVKDNKWRILN